MDSGPNQSINWGAYREGVQSELPRFESLQHDGPELTESYQAVLDRQETFTQYFSDTPLESYMLDWVGIFRDGVFEKLPDGSYQCDYQGKPVKIDESLHESILLNRCFIPADSNAFPCSADVEKETAIILGIEADVLGELDGCIKYIEKLKQLQLALRRRRSKLEGLRGPMRTSHTPQMPGLQCPRLSEPVSSKDAGFERSLRSLSESSDMSSGDDIPYAALDEEPDQGVPDGHGDTVVPSSQQLLSILASNTKGPPVPPLPSSTRPSPSNPPPPTRQTRGNTRSSPQIKEEKPAKRRPSGRKPLKQPPSKKQKVETPPSPADLENLNPGEELATVAGKLDRPARKRIGPERPRKGGVRRGPGRPRKKDVRRRRIFTEYEREHVPAWFKAQVAASKTRVQIERAYLERFGVSRTYDTFRQFVDRLDKPAADAAAAAALRAPNTNRTFVVSTPSNPPRR
ncbi:hypothetical protein N7535_003004 [Penicillium sp. DV-2018c]|nr:hypothetical protein N7535_003004 [Penicillium sp. DV-2018c]